MGPRAKPSAPAPVMIDPTDPRWADVVASIEADERGEGVTLTADEAERYYATGELPEHVRVAAREPGR